jgi:hypothetical protein
MIDVTYFGTVSGMNEWERKPKHLKRTWPSAASSTTDSTSFGPVSNAGRRCGKPTTNRLSYGTVFLDIHTLVGAELFRYSIQRRCVNPDGCYKTHKGNTRLTKIKEIAEKIIILEEMKLIGIMRPVRNFLEVLNRESKEVLYCTFSSFHVASVILTPRLVGNIFS